MFWLSEIIDTETAVWHRMRGTQMVAAMKIISIGFDIDRLKIKRIPNFLEFWSYILCPGNVVMGPWISYNDYLQIYDRPRWVSFHITNCNENFIDYRF